MNLLLLLLFTSVTDISLFPVFVVGAPAPNYGYLPCSICDWNDTVMLAPGATIPAGTIDFIHDEEMVCITLELQAETAQFSISQCAALRAAADICDCRTLSPIAPTANIPVLEISTAPIPPAPILAVAPTPAPIAVVVNDKENHHGTKRSKIGVNITLRNDNS